MKRGFNVKECFFLVLRFLNIIYEGLGRCCIFDRGLRFVLIQFFHIISLFIVFFLDLLLIDGIYKFLGLRLPKTALEFPKPESKTFKKKYS